MNLQVLDGKTIFCTGLIQKRESSALIAISTTSKARDDWRGIVPWSRQSVIFPQFVNGEVDGIRNRTRIIAEHAHRAPEHPEVSFQGLQGEMEGMLQVRGSGKVRADFQECGKPAGLIRSVLFHRPICPFRNRDIGASPTPGAAFLGFSIILQLCSKNILIPTQLLSTCGIFLEAAHPAKFPEIVKQAIGPALPALPQIRELEGRESRAVRIHSGFRELKEYLRSC